MARANSKPTTTKPDPIFALIEAQKSAEAAHSKAVKAFGRVEDAGGSVAEKRANAEVEATENLCGKTMKKLCGTKPTTLAGVAAMAAYCGREYDCDFHDKRTQKIFSTLAAAITDLDKRSVL